METPTEIGTPHKQDAPGEVFSGGVVGYCGQVESPDSKGGVVTVASSL